MKTTKTSTAFLFVSVTVLCAFAAISGCSKTDSSAPGAPTDTAKIQAEGAKNAAGQAARYQQMQNQQNGTAAPQGAPVGAPVPPGPR